MVPSVRCACPSSLGGHLRQVLPKRLDLVHWVDGFQSVRNACCDAESLDDVKMFRFLELDGVNASVGCPALARTLVLDGLRFYVGSMGIGYVTRTVFI